MKFGFHKDKKEAVSRIHFGSQGFKPFSTSGPEGTFSSQGLIAGTIRAWIHTLTKDSLCCVDY